MAQDVRLRIRLESETAGAKAGLRATGDEVKRTKEEFKQLAQEADKSARSIEGSLSGLGDNFDFGEDISSASEDFAGFAENITLKFAALTNPIAAVGTALVATVNFVSDFAEKFEAAIQSFKNNPFIAAAVQVQTFEAQLKSLTGSTALAKEEIARLTDYAAKTPFDLPGLVEASIQLKTFSQDTQRFLPVAATLAAVAGRTVPEAAAALGKALSGIPEGLTQLQESFRLTKRDLIAAGAQLDHTGAITVKTVGAMEKLGDAVQKASKAKFGDVIGEQSRTLGGAISNLEDEFGKLKAQIGQTIAPLATSFVGFTSKALEGLNSVYPAINFVVTGLGALNDATDDVASAWVGFMTGVISFGDTFLNLADSFDKFKGAVTGATAEQKKMEEQNQKTKEAFKENADMVGKTTEELIKMGKTSKDVVTELEVLYLTLEKARASKAPDATARVAAIEAEIAAVRGAKTAIAEHESATGQTAAAVIKNADAIAERYVRFGVERKEQIYTTKEEELSALDQIQAANKKAIADLTKQREESAQHNGENDPETKKLEARLNQAKQFEIELRDDRIDLARDAASHELQIFKQKLASQLELGQISKAEEARQLEQLAANTKYTFDERASLSQEAAQNDIESQKEIKEATLTRIEAEKDALNSKQAALDLSLSRGKNIAGDEKALLEITKQSYATEIDLIRQRAQIELAHQKDPSIRADITATAEAKIVSLNNQETEALRKIGITARQVRAEQLKDLADLKQSQISVLQAELAGIDAKIERGAKLEESAKATRKKIQTETEEQIRMQEQADLKGAATEAAKNKIKTIANNQIAVSQENFRNSEEAKDIESISRVAQKRLDGIKTEQAALENRKNILQDEIDLGLAYGNNQEKFKQIIRDQLELKKQELKAQEDVAAAGKTGSDLKRIEKDYQNQVTGAIRESKMAMEELNDKYKSGNKELDEQVKKLNKINGLVDAKQNEVDAAGENSGPNVSSDPNLNNADSDLFDLKKRQRIQAEKVKDLELKEKRKRDAQADRDLKNKGTTTNKEGDRIPLSRPDSITPQQPDSSTPSLGGGGASMSEETGRAILAELQKQTKIGAGMSGSTKDQYADLRSPFGGEGLT